MRNLILTLLGMAAISFSHPVLAVEILPFAVISDTQETLKAERILLGREVNNRESGILMQALANEKPEFLLMLGDFVCWGSSEKHWEHFDHLMKPVAAEKIPIWGALGNHDYMGSHTQAFPQIYARFPQLKKSHWYEKKYAGLALLILDSNQKEMPDTDWMEQAAWLKATIKKIDADSSVRGFFLFAHHPAYTNSTITGDEPAVQDTFLPLLLASKKGLGYISGHAHGYEHFVENGRQFIVSGGGGGPRVSYLTGKKARHDDHFSHSADKRPFNYLLVLPTANSVEITVRGLLKGESEIKTIDHISVSYPTTL